LVGRQEWLDRPSYRFEHLVGIAFNSLGRRRDRIANALNGVWLGQAAGEGQKVNAAGALAGIIPGHRCSHAPGRQAQSHPQRKSREDG
jgi:hypothetical protein